MGLEKFSSEDTKSSSGSSSSSSRTSRSRSTNSSGRDLGGYFKVVTNGIEKISQGAKAVTFENESDWQQAMELVDKRTRYDEDSIDKLPQREKYQLLHQAVLAINTEEKLAPNLNRECYICDEVFNLPTEDDFVEYKGETFCPSHTIKEVETAMRNEIENNKEEEQNES